MEVLKVKQDVSAGALTREELSVLNSIAESVMDNLKIREREGDGHYDGYSVEFSATISVEDAITLNSARRKTRRMLCGREEETANAKIMKVNINKNGTRSITELSPNEASAIVSVLKTANERCFTESLDGLWWSNDDFVCCLSDEEREALREVCRALI